MISRRAVLGATAGLGVLAGCSSAGSTTDPTPSPSRAASSAPPTTSPTSAASSSTPTASPTPSRTPSPTTQGPPTPRIGATIAQQLNVPWGIVFLPNGDALVGERDSGRIVRVTAQGKISTVGTVAGVQAPSGLGEGGLLGLALHPSDPTTLFAYTTTASDNRVVRIDLSRGIGTPTPILTGIATSTHHNGGALLFAGGSLYVSTGDAENSANAQSRASLNGKVLRITPDGAAAASNPFGNRTWSYGHRNVEGLALDAAGRVWATEFGEKASDELNLITKGGNYGWPTVEGKSSDSAYVSPKLTWSSTSTCSPAGLAITRSTAFVGALKGECLFSVPLDGTTAGTPVAHFAGQFGRIRQVVVAPDGALWMTSSNTDVRTTPGAKDDLIVRVTL